MKAKLTENERAFQKLWKNHSKAEIARAAGITRQSVDKWEAVPTKHVAKIAEAFGLPVEKLRPEPYAVP